MLKLYCGYDPAEKVGFYTFLESVLSRTDPNKVEIIPICRDKGSASNRFNMHWTEVPRRAGFRGRAVYADGCDMLCRADILELPDLLEPGCDVAVVQHNYSTKYPVKFLGQPNEDYERKNWASLIVFDNGNAIWHTLEEKIRDKPWSYVQRFGFLKDSRIGELPREWNWLVGEYPFNPDAKLAHFTIGGPWWPEYQNWDYADEWRAEWKKVNYHEPWTPDDSQMVSER